MDMETRRDTETMAEWAATQDAWDRLRERRARRHRSLGFWFSWRQVVDDPVAAVSASGGPLPMLPSGADTGAAGSRGSPSTAALTPSTSGSPPRRPHHLCSEASRISAATTWHH